jgi:hypothetical protein
MTQFCTACGRAVKANSKGKQIRYHCPCGANHVSLRGADGTAYLARVYPVTVITHTYNRNATPSELAHTKGNA